MKVKAIKKIPMWESRKGLSVKDWEKLNNGEAVELKKIPELAKEYLKIIKEK